MTDVDTILDKSFKEEPNEPNVIPEGIAHDPLVKKICEKMIKRSNAGVKKYGNTMLSSSKDIIEWLDDAIEENLDSAVYLEKIKMSVKAYRKWNLEQTK